MEERNESSSISVSLGLSKIEKFPLIDEREDKPTISGNSIREKSPPIDVNALTPAKL